MQNDQNRTFGQFSDDTNTEVSTPKRPQFGTRFLKEGDDVYHYNAWDNVEWDESQLKTAQDIVSSQSKSKMSEEDFEKIEKNADHYWNEFYSIHNDKFYKDRQWLFTEYPELLSDVDNDVISNSCKQKLPSNSKIIFEIGCGVGNTVFPILQQNPDPNIHVYCCDFSETAINILKGDKAYDTNRCTAFTYDITRDDKSLPLEFNSVDIILAVYVLSSIRPDKMKNVLSKLLLYLKPGGMVLFRDYGRYDLAQLRFRSGRYISDNFYARGEGTLVYFFDKEEVEEMFQNCGYKIIKNICEKRLQVNRRKQLKMYRVWILGKFMKPLESSGGASTK